MAKCLWTRDVVLSGSHLSEMAVVLIYGLLYGYWDRCPSNLSLHSLVLMQTSSLVTSLTTIIPIGMNCTWSNFLCPMMLTLFWRFPYVILSLRINWYGSTTHMACWQCTQLIICLSVVVPETTAVPRPQERSSSVLCGNATSLPESRCLIVRLAVVVIPLALNIFRRVPNFAMSYYICGHVEESDVHAILERPYGCSYLGEQPIWWVFMATRVLHAYGLHWSCMASMDGESFGDFIRVMWEWWNARNRFVFY